jgi:hypothetical protein
MWANIVISRDVHYRIFEINNLRQTAYSIVFILSLGEFLSEFK